MKTKKTRKVIIISEIIYISLYPKLLEYAYHILIKDILINFYNYLIKFLV